MDDDVSVRHAEVLDERGELVFQGKQISENRYLNAAGRQVHPWFSWSGFRYFEITGSVSGVTVYEIHNGIAPTATLETGNETLNWLFHTYLYTQQVNMHGGVPSDCPHRERLGYTGDGQLTCESAMLTPGLTREFSEPTSFARSWQNPARPNFFTIFSLPRSIPLSDI